MRSPLKRKAPTISWGSDFDTDRHYARVTIPFAWLMERSHLKRQIQLWWWLTKLVWTMPK